MKHNEHPSPGPIVIGAGVAGLAAAVRLAKAGVAPRVLEARPYVGGRARSFKHASGDEIDNGQHLLMGCYHATLHLLGIIGTRHLVALQPRLTVGFRDADGTTDILAASRGLPSPLDVLAGLLRLRRLSFAERIGLLRVARAAMRSSHAREETVGSLLDRLKQGGNAQKRLWNPMVIATMNTPPEEASAQLFLEVLRRAFLGRGDDSRLALPRAGLSQLFDPAAEFVRAAGGDVSLGTSVTRIEKVHEGFSVYVKEGDPQSATHLILALPPAQTSRLLEGIVREVDSDGKSVRRGAVDVAHAPLHSAGAVPGDGIEMSPIVSIYLWYDRPLPNVPEMTALIGTSVQWVFNRRRIVGEARNHGGLLSCTISAADAESSTDSAAIIAIAERELRAAFVELGDAVMIDAIVLKEKQATFRAVPQMLRPGARSSVERLYLAGDWTATALPATIEGAAQSGFAAADALIEDMRAHRN